jgi:hypothetical protein
MARVLSLGIVSAVRFQASNKSSSEKKEENPGICRKPPSHGSFTLQVQLQAALLITQKCL